MMPENRGLKGLKNRLEYWLDTVSRVRQSKGEIITISGVDGAGKSTIIENLAHMLDKKFRRRIIILRHRPSLLPILSVWSKGKKKAHEAVMSRLPRTGRNNNSISSIIRFSYYYIDYLIGQWFVYIKYLLRGYTVIYDRYYFDFINDGKRSNLSIPKWLTRFGYRFLLKPKYNFFLYAAPEIILKRKQELDRETILTLTQDYLTLFREFDKKRREIYLPIENLNIENTLNIIQKNMTP